MQHLLPTHPCMPQTKRQTLKYTLILACRSASFQSTKLFYYRKSPTRDHTESPCKPCANNHTLTARQAAEQGRAMRASCGNTSSAQGVASTGLSMCNPEPPHSPSCYPAPASGVPLYFTLLWGCSQGCSWGQLSRVQP